MDGNFHTNMGSDLAMIGVMGLAWGLSFTWLYIGNVRLKIQQQGKRKRRQARRRQ